MRDVVEHYLNESAKLTVSSDKMLAYISLMPWMDEEKPDVRDLTDFLEDQKITEGIQKDNIKKMLEEKIFYQNVLVARGTEKQDGENGWIEYLVDVSEKGNKPKILSDGSVDYRSIGDIEVVEAGTEIARYHPATPGVNGVTVDGEVTKAKPGKQLYKLVQHCISFQVIFL